MKQVYMAEDGKIFETKEACLEYEKPIEGVFAFGPNGRVCPSKKSEIFAIWFESQEAYDWFFNGIDYEELNTSLEGLEEAEDYHWGTVFVWSEYEERYFPIWNNVIKTLQKISKE